MAIEPNKILTFNDLVTLRDEEGFVQKNPFTPSLKAVTKQELVNALWVDESGTFGTLPNNRLIARLYVQKANLLQKSIFRTAGDNNSGQASKGNVSIPILFEGLYELPIVGDRILNSDGSPFSGINIYYGVRRYPGANDEENIRVDYNGYVTERGWVNDKNQVPSGIVVSNIGRWQFTLSFQGGSLYENIWFQVQQYYGDLWQTVASHINEGQSTFVTEIDDSRGNTFWRIRCFEATPNFGAPALFIKTTQQFWVEVLPLLTKVYLRSSLSGVPCTPSNTNFFSYYVLSFPIQVGDYIYTDAKGTTKLNGSGNWWYSEGETINYRIGTDGLVQAIASCP